MHENTNSPTHKSESERKCPNLFAPRACAFSGLHSRNPFGSGPVNGIEELVSSQGTCPTAKIDQFLLQTYHWKSLLRCHRAGWTSVACVACKGHIEGKGNQGEHCKTIKMILQWILTVSMTLNLESWWCFSGIWPYQFFQSLSGAGRHVVQQVDCRRGF